MSPPGVGRFHLKMMELVGSRVTPEKFLALRFKGDDGQLYEFDISTKTIPVCIYSFLRHLEEVTPHATQALHVTGMTGGNANDGSPMIKLLLKEGGHLPLILESGDIEELIRFLQGIGSPKVPLQ